MAEEESEGGGGLKLIIIVIVVLLLLGGGGAVAYVYLFPSEDAKDETSAERSREEAAKDISASSQKEAVALKDPQFTDPKEYTVNLRDGKHFLTVTIQLVVEDPKALTYLNDRSPFVEDMIVTMLSNQTTEDLRTPSGKDLLRREIHKKVNSLFSQEFIDDSKTHDTTPVKKILIPKWLLN